MADPADWASIGQLRRSEASSREKELAKDRDAYRRLRREGLQPPTLTGAAQLEAKAHSQLEIERGYFLKTPEDRCRMEEATALAREWNENHLDSESFGVRANRARVTGEDS
jgi:hypothetical protein